MQTGALQADYLLLFRKNCDFYEELQKNIDFLLSDHILVD